MCRCLSTSSIRTIPGTSITIPSLSACFKISPNIQISALSPEEILKIVGYNISPFCFVIAIREAVFSLRPIPNLVSIPVLLFKEAETILFKLMIRSCEACRLLYNS